jgi:hypothetical protein
MDAELAKLIGAGGIAASLLALIYLVGSRLVVAIDKLVTRVGTHETTEFAHHTEVKQQLVLMQTKIDQALDIKSAVQEAVEEISGVHEAAGSEWKPKTPPYGIRKPTRGG